MGYDKLGNPTSYYNGASYDFSWSNGRQLSMVRYGSAMTTYYYNADGIRTKKVGSSTVEYVLDGTKILAEKNGSRIIRYLYDAQDMPVGMILDGTTYLYEKNLQGDIVGIYTTGGTKVVTYNYDAWGKMVSYSVASGYTSVYTYNPFRYRGYYYDVETGFYYLQSRYYDPATGSFLNADGYVNANGDLQGFNMYAYCSNNPIMYVDYTGDIPILFPLIVSIIVAVAEKELNKSVRQNNANNKALDKNPQTTTRNKIIRDQHADEYVGFKYGLYNISWNGCEAIAIHNVKLLKGMESDLSQTMIDCQNADIMFGYGLFGSVPKRIGRVLDRYGIAYQKISSIDEISEYGTYILSYWNGARLFSSLHTVAVVYSEDGYEILNDPTDFTDIKEKKFICGYYIE